MFKAIKQTKKKAQKAYLAACCGVFTTMTMSSAYAQDASQGLGYVREQGANQLAFLVNFFLILAFAIGIVFIVIGGMKIPKLAKQQLPDDEKKDVYMKIGTGALLLLIPLVIAVTTGILGGSAEGAAEAAQGVDWGL